MRLQQQHQTVIIKKIPFPSSLLFSNKFSFNFKGELMHERGGRAKTTATSISVVPFGCGPKTFSLKGDKRDLWMMHLLLCFIKIFFDKNVFLENQREHAMHHASEKLVITSSKSYNKNINKNNDSLYF